MNQNGRLWTEDEDDVLREMWTKYSARQIGDLVGHSRNAVISRAHRILLEAKGSNHGGRPHGYKHKRKITWTDPPPKPSRWRAYTRGPYLKRVHTPRPEVPLPPDCAPVSFFDLEPNHCRYPITPSIAGEGFIMLQDEPMMYCGAEMMCCSYCPYHYGITYRRSNA